MPEQIVDDDGDSMFFDDDGDVLFEDDDGNFTLEAELPPDELSPHSNSPRLKIRLKVRFR